MNVDNDWLDQRLAVKDTYIPDEGFTARVMGHVPKKQPATAGRIRWRVLSISVAIAFCLFVLQIVPLLQNLNPLLTHYTSPDALNDLIMLCQSPAVLFSIAGSVILLGFAAIPLLRRWV
jgi:hypothetical protein